MRRLLILLVAFGLATGGAFAVDFPGTTENFDGPTKVGVVLVRFADIDLPNNPNRDFSAADIDKLEGWVFDPAPGPSVNHLFQEMSFGVDSLFGDIVATVDIPHNGYEAGKKCYDDYYSTGAMEDWKASALALADPNGDTLVEGNAAGYQQVMLIFSKGSKCDGAFGGVNGVAYRVSNPIPGGVLPATSIFNWKTPQTIAHEVGHLKGWHHSQLAGYTEGYGDLSCVMGDNYVYHGHPDYFEFADPGETNPKILQMRHAGAPWKLYSGYMDPADLFDVPDGAPSETVFLAPTQIDAPNFPIHPLGETIHHGAVIELEGDTRTYVVSYRRGSLSAYDSNLEFVHLMGRVEVHSFIGGDTRREASLEAGETFTGDKFVVTAVTDGLLDEEFVEVLVEVDPLYQPNVTVPPLLPVSNPNGLDSDPIQVTVENTGPTGTAAADFDVTLTASDPEIVGAVITPATVTLAAGQSTAVDVVLQFSGALDDDSYMFEITAADTVGPRDVGVAVGHYTTDSVPPVIDDLQGEHRFTEIELTWTPETYSDSFSVERDGGVTQLGFNASNYVDTAGIVPGSCVDYIVTATDFAGNSTSEPIQVCDLCSNGFTFSVSPLDFQVTDPINQMGAVANYNVTIDNPNPQSCGTNAYSVVGTGSLGAGYSVGGINVQVPPESSAAGTMTLAFFQQPPPSFPLPNNRIGFDVVVTEPNGSQQSLSNVLFTYDTAGPTAPPYVNGSQNNVAVSLNWGAASDATTSVVSYRITRDGSYMGTVSGLQWTDTNPPTTRPLTYTIRGIDEVGNLGAPKSKTFTTFPGCPKCPPPHQQ